MAQKQEEGKGCGIIILSILILPILIVPLVFFYHLINGGLETKYRGFHWDDAQGTINSVSVFDTGKIVDVRIYRNNHPTFEKERLYSGNFIINYNYKGQFFTKNNQKDLAGEDAVKSFGSKYYNGKIISLKVNPHNIEDTIIKPNYNIITALLIFYVLVSALSLFMIIKFIIKTVSVNRAVDLRGVRPLPRDLFAEQFWTSIADPLRTNQRRNANGVHFEVKVKGGIRCKNYTIKKDNTVFCLLIKSFDALSFYAISLLIIAFGICFLQDKTDALKLYYYSAIFCLFSFFVFQLAFLKFNQKIFFNKLLGYYWVGRSAYNKTSLFSYVNKNQLPLSDIRAIQLLFVENNVLQDETNSHYEVNLILQSGRRVNVLNTNSFNIGCKYSSEIAEFLALPLYLDPKIK